MKSEWKKSIWLVSAVLVSSLSQYSNAASLSTKEGAVHEGTIAGLFKGIVTIGATDGAETEVSVDALEPSSADAVTKWAKQNPHLVDVYQKFDSPPSPAKTNNPSRFLDRDLVEEKGMVAVDIVISEKGEVIWANVAKSSNENLNEASVEAISEWKFKPAMVGGSPIRSRIRVPFKY